MRDKKAILYLIIPCYNEEMVLPITSNQFLTKIQELIDLGKINENSRILFVNDGSKDRTWDIICGLARKDNHFAGISQSRNRGHQNAVLAGLMESKDNCDITISIDCDGQDDLNAILKFPVVHKTGAGQDQDISSANALIKIRKDDYWQGDLFIDNRCFLLNVCQKFCWMKI